MKFNVTIDRDEDGVWIVECPSIPSCVSQGETKDQALANIQDAITACLQVRRDRLLPLDKKAIAPCQLRKNAIAPTSIKRHFLLNQNFFMIFR